MQSASSRIWTRVTVSISNDDNHYTTGTNYINNEYRTNQSETEELSSFANIYKSLFILSFDKDVLDIK